MLVWEIQIKPWSISPKLRADQYLFLIHIRYYFKISLTSNKFLKCKKNFTLAKKPKWKIWKFNSNKEESSKILDGQKHLYFVKDFFLPFYPKKKFFGKFFHLSWITSHNRIALIILRLITYIDLTKLLGWTILVEAKSNTFLNYSR